MPQEFNLWKHQIRQAIAHLSNIEFSLPDGDGASFREAMRVLYQEGQFTEFLAFEGWRQTGLSEEAGKALAHLCQLLDEYDEPDSDAAIQADPDWRIIAAHASQVAALLC